MEAGREHDLSALIARLDELQALILTNAAQAEAPLLACQAQAQALAAPEVLTYATLLLGGCAFYRGHYPQMLTFAEEALHLSRQHQLVSHETRALNGMGLAYQRLGELAKAMHCLLESLKVAEQHSDPAGCCRALLNIGLVHDSLGEYEMALSLHEQALLAAHASGQQAFMADALYSRLEDHYKLGHYPQALALSDEVLEFAQQHQFSRFECGTQATIAATLLKLGRPEAAWQAMQAGLALAEERQDRESVCRLLVIKGKILLALGQLAQAEQALTAGLALSQELQHQTIERKANGALAQLYDRLGQFEQAYQHLQRQTELLLERISTERAWRTQQLAAKANIELSRSPTITGLREIGAVEHTRPNVRDTLTSAVSRPFFQNRVQKTLELLAPEENMGLLFVSVDHMRSINESYGPKAGDHILIEVARRLQDSVRAGDLVGRVSGDEFMLLLGNLALPEDLQLVMDKLLGVLRQPIRLTDPERGELELNITASLGGVVAPEDGQNIETLYRHADLALQQVKQTGRNAGVRFQPYMSAEEEQRRKLEFELRGAAGRGELRLYYQAQYDLPERKLLGYEALVRWQHPRLGLLGPNLFIPLAEESHLIQEIGDWVLHEACRQAAEWNFPERGLLMSVNVSAMQFEQPNFVRRVEQALRQHSLHGHNLALELTESMVQRNQNHAVASIQELQALGVGVALDDFGTGYSSLSMLQTLPFEMLKIDRSFLNDLLPDSPSYARALTLLEVVVKLAHNLNMKVVAEGIEHEEQYCLLCELGCNAAQGYWFTRPLPPEEAGRLLA